ncbi:flagellar filament capping protein FliD [Alkalicoccobacillus murimartini]|uniref:Flagellar hook-associated protein 2 n=1 Tax=Alkalicoccobacillus murimartini TaxID=171685 RepID=A0ABT9YI94_9BACI|nr:flagellar filament capping protein FliD [Alkalicoccobacillus murimartini]MDQ0206759.1 flagellar hook-associated protein 2 [Alkalicoccobacillus murimartini]
MMRLSGMATGMDIDQIVKDLMRAERLPLDKIVKNQNKLEWKMEDYREINLKLRSFSDSIFDNLMRSSVMKKRTVQSSNSSLVTATASSNIGNTSFTMSKVEQLATSATNSSSSSVIRAGEGTKSSTSTLKQLNDSFDVALNWETGGIRSERLSLESGSNETQLKETPIDLNAVVVKVNGKTMDVVTGTYDKLENGQVHVDNTGKLTFADSSIANTTIDVTYAATHAEKSFKYTTPAEGAKPKLSYSVGVRNIEQVVVRGESGTTYTAQVNNETGQLTFSEDGAPQENFTVEYTQKYTTAGVDTVNANGDTVHGRFIFTDSQSLDTVMKSFNDSNVGVNMFWDDHSGRISVTRKETGVYSDGAEMTFTGALLTNTFKLDQNNEKEGTNAKFTVNGLETERRTNSFTISGMNVTLKDTFDQEVVLNASTDVDSVVDTIKKFVDQYNELLDHVNGKLTESRKRDYEPLTQEERDGLSEKEAERWDEQARAGHLRNDPLLRGSFDQMRQGLYSTVNTGTDSEFTHLSAIGITTSSDYMSRGKLEINEDKLRAAIEKDPDGVFDLFNADGETPGEQGIARRLRTSISNTVESISQRAGGAGYAQNHQFTIGRELNDIEKRISTFEMRLEQKEKRYWAQFNAMEAAVQRANNQGDMLMAQLMGNG